MKLSVIVPIRNGEKFLNKCIDSILNQTEKDFELILINDGSTDKSQEIIDSYIEKDDRIIGINVSGLKVNAVRKVGVEIAKGSYVTFVDCDDWIDADMYSCLLEICQKDNLDVLSSGMIREFVEENRTQVWDDTLEEGVYDKEKLRRDIYPFMLSKSPFFTHGIQPSIWNKIFKKEIVQRIYRDIDTDIIYGEDATVVYAALLESNRFGLIKRRF